MSTFHILKIRLFLYDLYWQRSGDIAVFINTFNDWEYDRFQNLDLRFVAGYYPSTGAVNEYLYSYVAVTELPDDSAGVFGVESEAEDIRGHLISFDRLMELLASGEIMNAPLVITALWLQRERARLRG